MKIAGLAMTDVWAHRVLRERGVETAQIQDAPADIKVLVESINLAHHSAAQNYRPYLHISGELRGVRPAEGLPHGIREVVFPPDGGESIDAYYEFSDVQLAQLAQKGYFTEEFEAPDHLTGFEWDLPANVDVVALAPDRDEDVPVVFVNVRDSGSLVITEETSGYELTDYFADFSTEGEYRIEQAAVDGNLRQRSDEINSLFTEEELTEGLDLREEAHAPQAQPEAAPVGFDAQIQDVEARLDQESERVLAERASTEGTPENLYFERVASALISPEPEVDDVRGLEESRVDEHGALDFGEDQDEDLDIAPVKIGRHSNREGSNIEETKAELARRAADLDHGDQASGREL